MGWSLLGEVTEGQDEAGQPTSSTQTRRDLTGGRSSGLDIRKRACSPTPCGR